MFHWRVLTAVAAFATAGTAGAAEWITYTSSLDLFRVHVPCEFSVTDSTWESEYGAVMPSRIYECNDGQANYKTTVVDYTDSQRLHAEREGRTEADYIDIYWEVDIRASIIYAASQIRQREGEVTFDAYHYVDRVEGEQIQMTYPDQRRLYASIYLLESKLYIFEATVPPRTPPPGMFQQSLEFVNAEGGRVRYQNFADAPKVHDAPDRAERARLRQQRQQTAESEPQ